MKFFIIVLLMVLQLNANSFLTHAKPGVTLGLSAKMVERAVNEQLPQTITYMLLNIKFIKAKLSFPVDSERIHTKLDAIVTMQTGLSEHRFEAKVNMSSGINYIASKDSVYLKDPNVENIVIKDVDPITSNYANGLINSALVSYYNKYPAHQLSAEQKAELMFAIEKLIVKNGRLLVTLGEKH